MRYKDKHNEEIEAIQFDGTEAGFKEMEKMNQYRQHVVFNYFIAHTPIPTFVECISPRGKTIANKNDYVIQDKRGGMYSIKEKIFEAVYKEVK